jgi:hypothetical protein
MAIDGPWLINSTVVAGSSRRWIQRENWTGLRHGLTEIRKHPRQRIVRHLLPLGFDIARQTTMTHPERAPSTA